MKTVDIAKAISEVWKWKDEVYRDIKDMAFEEKREYYDKSLKRAVKTLKET